MSSLLAAALSAATRNYIISYDEYINNSNYSRYAQNLDQDAIHQSYLVGGEVPNKAIVKMRKEEKERTEKILSTINLNAIDKNRVIFVETLTGEELKIPFDPKFTVEEIKAIIEMNEETPAADQKLIFAGQRLEDGRCLADYNITKESTLQLVLIQRGGGGPIYYLDEMDMAPQFDYDFTNIDDDGVTFTRGGFQYKRPCGWKRIALNVLDKYENNIWLGVGGKGRKSLMKSADSEWPVSYHGTAENNCKSIAKDGYVLALGKRFAFGHGIYSSPDIDVAALYATQFTHEGDNYRVVIQNRVNPKTLVRVPANKGCSSSGEYWISPKGSDLRPYGVCVKKDLDSDSNSDSD